MFDKKIDLQRNLWEASQSNALDYVQEILADKIFDDPDLFHSICENSFLTAINYNHAEIVRLLLARGLSPEVKNKMNGNNGLHFAVQSDALEIVELLLEKSLDVDSVNNVGQTPLAMAALHNRPAIAQRLLTAGANPNTWNSEGDSPLHLAANSNAVEVAALLLNAGAQRMAVNHKGFQPLHNAVIHDAIGVMKLLVKAGVSIDVKNRSGQSPLHLCAESQTSDKALRFLLEHGADLEIRNLSGMTPVHYFCRTQKPMQIGMLLTAGADPNARTPTGLTAVALSLKDFLLENTEVLIDHGAGVLDVDGQKTDALKFAQSRYKYGYASFLRKIEIAIERQRLSAVSNTESATEEAGESMGIFL